jgi:RHS repeat-associated protein
VNAPTHIKNSPKTVYPFGMQMPGRTFSSESYRYGFQGQEKDDEIKGDGNSINYKYRVHDPRIGKFLSIDPLYKKYPFYSPYAFSGNRVIDAVEQEGLQPERVTETAEGFDGTPYEFGGKDPAFVGGLPNEMTEEWYLENIGWPSSNNGGRYNNPNYTNEVNLNQFLTDGATSCGIDCSGLSGTAFNADEQKLMDDFNLYNQNAAAQRQAFRNAEATEGYLGDNFEYVSQGDLVFNGTATHVMVATGEIRTNDGGQIEIQIINAPQTGDYVRAEWRTVGDNWTYGHTFRTTEYVLPIVEVTVER